jgi:Right handed beta helix region
MRALPRLGARQTSQRREKKMRKSPFAVGTVATLLAFGGSAAVASTAQASTGNTAYVSPSGSTSGADASCATAGYASISKAVGAVSAGGTVVVCRGVYHAQVVVTKPLTLAGQPGAVIDAHGQKPLTIGKTKLPGSVGIGVLGTHNVRVSGFKVRNAGFDAILVGLSSRVSVSHNVLRNNGDVGVDLNGSSWSQAIGNVSENNMGGGFLVADDVGPNSHNVVAWNLASHNPGGCGVILAGHSTAGVTDNLVAHNVLTYNGTLKSTGGGAGVVIATEVPGETVADNTVAGNLIYGNGLAGVTIHSHLPGQDLNGNQITGNVIGTNNTLGDPIQLATSPASKKNVAVPDTRTTGILVGSASPIHVWISGNRIARNHFGIFLEGVGQAVHATLHGNQFHRVFKPVKSVIVH